MTKPKNNKKPRRSAPRRKTSRPKQLSLNHEESMYLEALTHPFGDGAVGARVPDDVMGNTESAKCTVNGTVTSGTGLKFALQCIPYTNGNSQDGPSVLYSYGTGSTRATTHTYYACDQTASVLALTPTYRIVGMGLKLWCTDVTTDDAGVMSGGLSDTALTENNNWPLWATIKSDLDSQEFKLARDGITVRWAPQSTTEKQYHAYNSHAAWTTDGFTAPTILVEGVSATQTFFFQADFHLEIKANHQSLGTSSMSPYSKRYGDLLVASNGQKMVVSGHSFFSFLSRAIPILRAIDGGVSTVANVIGKVRAGIDKGKRFVRKNF